MVSPDFTWLGSGIVGAAWATQLCLLTIVPWGQNRLPTTFVGDLRSGDALAMRLQYLGGFLPIDRPPKQISLSQFASKFPDLIRLKLCFDTFCDHADS
jgi:hypothetical protein